MTHFAGRSVLVTGAGGAIGGAITRRLVAAGAHVIAAGLTEAELGPIVAETGATSLPFDLTSEASVRDALEQLDLYGAVNCGGLGGAYNVTQEADLSVFDAVISVNTRGALLVTKYAARSMIRLDRGGAIVNISSQAALVALRGHVSYAASKAAMDGITRVSALELGQYGIRVNSVNPTVVMSSMSAGYWGQPHIEEPFLKAMPLGRWATEDDIAGPVIFLLSGDAGMITGITLPVDGGYTCQ